MYAQLKCRQQGILEAQEALVAKFDERFGGSADHQRKIQKMKRVHDGSTSAAARTNQGHFKNAAKKQRHSGEDSCVLQLQDGAADTNLNGICDPDLGEKCASATDSTKACDPTKKHGKNDDCARVCGDDVVESTEEAAADVVVAQDLLKAYDDTESTLVETHNKLDDGAMSTPTRLAAATSCPPAAPDSVAADVLRITEATLDAIATSAEPACGQTVVGVAFGFGGGGNTKWACIILDAAHAIAQIAFSIVDVVQQGHQGQWYVDSVTCLKDRLEAISLTQAAQTGDLNTIADSIRDVRTDVAAAQLAIRQDMTSQHQELTLSMAAHGKEMREYLVEVMLLLSTPQGQRSGFPAK